MMLILLLWQWLLTPLQAETPPAEPRPWSLNLPMTIPDGLGADIGYQWNPWLNVHAFYHLPTPIHVKTKIKSRKLVDRDGFIIRSPTIDLPFKVQLGPHQGMGASFQPWSSPFYLMLDLEQRLVKIDSLVQSHLEVIDSQSRIYTNTLFEASASTRTEQTLLRSTFGYRWNFGESDYFCSLFSGWSRPLHGHSSVRTRVRVRNPEASDPANVDARNLQDAEAQQEHVIRQKLVDELKKFETRSLPVLGISFGKYL